MQHLAQVLSRSTDTPATLWSVRLGRFLKSIHFAAAHQRLLATLGGIVFLGSLGWLDLETVKGLNFEFYYLFGCAVVGWVAGAPSALVCTLISATLLYCSETLSSPGTVVCCSVPRTL